MSQSESEAEPLVRRAGDIEYEAVDLAEGLRKGVHLGEKQHTPNFNMRQFVLEAGASVPRHTNEVEHEQYVIEGEYTVGIGDQTHTVTAGDSVLIPAGVEHWYRNENDTRGSFICMVPKADDEITVTDTA